MKSSNFDLIVIGHLLKEKIIFPDGKEVGPVLGSPAAYASVAAAKLGLRVGLVTKIGRDMPEELLRVFKEVGVDTGGTKIGDNTTTNLLIYEESGEKRLEFLKKADDISFEDIPAKYLDSCHVFLIVPIDYEIPESLIKLLRQKGKRLSMELSGFGGASSSPGNCIESVKFLEKIVPYFEIVKGGSEDCQRLFGKSRSQEYALSQFLEWGAKMAILTGGEKETVLKTEKETFSIPSFPAKAVDLTGAGDVWHAAFLAEYISGIKKSAIFASAAASILIEKTGGVTSSRMPAVEQVYERVRET